MRPGTHGVTVARPHVLVVDDYAAVLESIARRLRLDGLQVHEASTGEGAVAIAREATLDLALIDYYLPGINGLDTGTSIQQPGAAVPWILFSGLQDERLAVAALSRGALDAVWAPFQAFDVVRRALEILECRRMSDWSRVLRCGTSVRTGTMVGRVGSWIVKACESRDDLATIEAWAAFVGVSYSSFRDGVSRIGIQPREIHRIMRIFRALARTHGRVEHIETELAIGDSRTARALMMAARLPEERPARPITVQDFLARQKFIPVDHPLLLTLLSILTSP